MSRVHFVHVTVLLVAVVAQLTIVRSRAAADERIDFVRDIQPLLLEKCVKCHGAETSKSGLRFDQKYAALAGGESGPVIIPKNSGKSSFIERITSRGDDKMPPTGEPLTEQQVEIFRRWIDQGAEWPANAEQLPLADKYDWWSLRPLIKPMIPDIPGSNNQSSRPASPIDAFILAKLREKGLGPSPQAERQTLGRRLYFDLIGLPPSPEEIESFVSDSDPTAYEQLVDKLLDSPHYGERWARHWLDVVHYGDTHGYDKDKPRPNAWPYRDYVIRAFNNDKPYSTFVEEQLAGDVVASETVDGITATGFIAAGPWDFIGHVEVPESKIDGKIARNLDRDDMVTNTCNTFISLTVQCARCHNHKFDPVIQEDYYRLQAVFAALDRADRPYDIDPIISQKRSFLIGRQKDLQEKQTKLEALVAEKGGESLRRLDQQIAEANQPDKLPLAAQFGYHSLTESGDSVRKWVQVDLGDVKSIRSIQIVGCHDNFNNIGAGFGFPVRFRIEVSGDLKFEEDVRCIVDQTERDFPNPGIKPQTFSASNVTGRYVRVTATKLAPRQNDFILALAELRVIDQSDDNVAIGRPVQALDSIENGPRWQRSNLVDGYYRGITSSTDKTIDELRADRNTLITNVVDQSTRLAIAENVKELAETAESLKSLPPPKLVYAGMVYSGSGSFTGTGGSGGRPRIINVLARGDVNQPLKTVGPGTVPLSRKSSGEFSISENDSESERRMALARWITSKDNPLTWRSIVNRVWQYHFGRGIVDSPNDFGRMGRRPSHAELLDWLAVEFRDGDQSLKRLHRLIVTSATYRQSSNEFGNDMNQAADGGNELLWRMNRRKLEAEAVRDAALVIAGKLNRHLGGPAFQDFVVQKPDHSPHYEYQLHDPNDDRIHRRSIYRFLVRSQPQPFMTTLDCADPSTSVDKRNETVTSLQALALLNNRLMLTMANEMAARVKQQSPELSQQVDFAFRLALSRPPTNDEFEMLLRYAQTYDLVSVCRVLMNLNEFVFVD